MYLLATDKHRRLARQLAAVWLLLMLALSVAAVVTLPSLKPDTDILNLLPAEKQNPLIMRARQHINSEWQDTVIWLAQGSSAADAVNHARHLQQQLQHSGLFRELTLQWQPQQNSGHYAALLPWRYQLLTAVDKQAISTDAEQFAASRLQQLYSPVGMQYAMTLQHDPFFTYGTYSNQLLAEQDAELFDDVVVMQDDQQHYALLLAQVEKAAFSQQKALAQLHQQLTADGTVLAAGMPLYSAYGAQSAEREISTVGTASILAIILFMLLAFRSLVPLSLSLLSIATGVLAAVVVCQLVFARLHVITLVFGSSLVGITVDYSFHYFCDRLRKDCGPAMNSLRMVLPGIALGVGSSLIAYGILLFTPFPALQQIGLFSVSGLLAAWLTVVLLFPLITQRLRLPDHVPLAGLYQAYLQGWPRVVYQWRYLFIPLLLVVTATGLLQLSAQDDIRAMQKPAATVQAQEQQIMALGRQRQDSQYFIVSAADADALLLHERQLTRQLNKLIDEQALTSYQALSSVLFTRAEQQQHWQLIKAQLFDSGIFRRSMQQLSMAPETINTLAQDFMQAEQQYLSAEQWIKTASPQWQLLWLGCEAQCSSIVRLSGIARGAELKRLAALADGDAVLFVDSVGDINHMLQQYRHIATVFLALAFMVIAVFLALFVGLRAAVKIVLVPLAAQLLALATLGLLGFSVSMFHLFGLLLALGISMDYAIFHSVGKHKLTVAMAVFLSLLTSLLAFGLLASSSTAFIQAFGLSLTLGISYAFLLAPLFTTYTPTTMKGLQNVD